MAGLNSVMLYVCGAIVIIAIGAFAYLKFFKKSNKQESKTPQSQNKKQIGLLSKKKSYAIDKSVRKSIPYLHTYQDGIIEVADGVFTKAYRINDINFKIAPEEEQTNIFFKYESLLNSFPVDTDFQVVIENRKADATSVFNNIQFVYKGDGLDLYRREMNDILIDKMQEGRNNIAQDKYLIVSLKANDIEEAVKRFKGISNTVNKKFLDISRDHPATSLSLVSRLKELHNIYNQDESKSFYNSKDKNGIPIFDINVLMSQGITTKDVIGPSGMDFSKSSYFMLGDIYGKSLYLENFPNYLSSDFLADLSDSLCNMLVSIHYKPIDKAVAVKAAHNMMLNITGQIAKSQKNALQNGYSPDLISPALAKQQKYIRDLINDITERDQKMFFVTMAITVFGKTKEEMEENVASVIGTANNYLCTLKPLFFQQERGLNSCLPLCKNELQTSKMLTTESAAIFVPYTTQELHQIDGLYYGLNDTSKNMILYNRLLGENYNGLILGESGNGKSFAAKQEMMSVLLKDPRNVVYVIDPEAEYASLAKAIGGEVIDLHPNSQTYINPMDMDLDYGENSDPIGMKTEYIISMIEIMGGKNRIISPEEKSIISRCVQQVYRPYLDEIDKENERGANITYKPKSMPTLSSLHRVLSMQPEEIAKGIASIIEMYSTGSLSTFAHRTNTNIHSRFVVYNVSKLGTGQKELGLHICLNDIWNKMIENERKGIYTWFYIDEFYLLLESESAAQFISSIWKRARKRNGVPTGILQNTGQLMATEDARDVLNNTSFVQIFSEKKIDRQNLKTLLSLSDSQLNYITDAGPGKGLLYANKTVLPFNNQFPKDKKLYEVMSSSATKDARMKERRMKFIE